MKTLRYLFCGALTAASVCGISAQDCENELWLSAGGKYNVTKNLRLEGEAEHRSQGGFFQGTSRWSGELGASYKWNNWLRTSASYVYINDHEQEETTNKGNIVQAYWQPAHRMQLSATGSMDIGRFELSLRECFQYTHSDSLMVDKVKKNGKIEKELIEGENSRYLRSRFQVEYTHSKKSILIPYVSAEVYSDIDNKLNTKKIRYTAGSDIKLGKYNTLSVYYRFIDRFNKTNFNIVGVGYTCKF